MDLVGVERSVREAADKFGLTVIASRRSGDVLSLDLMRNGGSVSPERCSAVIWTTGVEAFFLEFDEKYSFGEYEWDTQAQLEALQLLLRLTKAYFDNEGREVSKGRRFGRKHDYFELSLDKEIYTFSMTGRVGV